MQLQQFEEKFARKIQDLNFGNDPAHDLAHFRRVVKTAKHLAAQESAVIEVVVPGAWLHDFVNVPKNDSRRSLASKLSADAATQYLKDLGYPEEYLDRIYHTIEAHSFSAKIEPKTIEAEIVQDADRLDGLGAIGIARTFSVAGLLHRRIYDIADPFAQNRELDELQFTVDHFYVKLFKTAETLRTQAGRAEGALRAQYMRDFLKRMAEEIQ